MAIFEAESEAENLQLNGLEPGFDESEDEEDVFNGLTDLEKMREAAKRKAASKSKAESIQERKDAKRRMPLREAQPWV